MPRLRDLDPDELGPYLRQHRDNPVDWYTWDDDAFALARASDRPVLLSVGYSSCHWCHVMAHESFEDAATAAVMNRDFVNIKVDREERPDVDAIYMQAVVAVAGRGGWPMTVFLDPDGRPFYGGTYFPPAEGHGMPSFGRVLAAMHDIWTNQRAEVRAQATAFQTALGKALAAAPTPTGTPLDASLLDDAVVTALTQYEPRFGGFSTAPKFPPAMTLDFLAVRYARDPRPEVLDAISRTLHAMADGGIHDQLGGGFARYSVDEQWLVPHFEKMLYDQALLLRAYTDGWLLTRDPRFAEVAAGIVTYVLRDLARPDGGFASAFDADSDGGEGRFYCWQIEEVRAVCGPDADAVIDFFGVSSRGNFTDPHTGFTGSILFRRHPERVPDEAVLRSIPALLAARGERVRPGLDEKVVLAWNALFSRSLLEAAAVFHRPDWHAAAVTNMEFVLHALRRDDGRFLRSWQRGHARHLAVAEDYAALLDALVTFAELDDPGWLEQAREVADALITHFGDSDGFGFFTTGADAPALIVRGKDTEDNAVPAANSLAAHGLLRLAALTGDRSLAAPALAIVERLAPIASKHPTAFAYLLRAADFLVGPSAEIAIVGDAEDPATVALREVLTSRLWPGAVSLTAPGPDPTRPLLAGRGLVRGAPAAYVCEHFTCRLPVTDPEGFEAELRSTLLRGAPDRGPAAG